MLPSNDDPSELKDSDQASLIAPTEKPEDGLHLAAHRRRGTSSEPERSPVLIAAFRDGYAAGWRFAVPEAFREALDIQYTERQVDKTPEFLWTQGRQFYFPQGSRIYDTPLAYTLPWGEALQHITLFVQVTESTPATESVSQTIRVRAGLADGDVEITGAEAIAAKGTIVNGGMTIERTKATAGRVKFAAFRPTHDLSGVEDVCTLACTQVEFVLLPQTGCIRDKKHRLRDLFKELDKFLP